MMRLDEFDKPVYTNIQEIENRILQRLDNMNSILDEADKRVDLENATRNRKENIQSL
jgi:hypothetical protein